MPPGQYPGYPPQGPPPGGQPPRKRGLPVGAVIGIIGGGVLLLVGIVVVAALVIGQVGAAQQQAAAAPSDTVVAYLTAIADGDAESALALLSQAPEDDTLLTDEVLATSAALAPLTDIEVVSDETDSGYGDVIVSYVLGDIPLTTSFGVSNYSGENQNEWLISGGLGYLPVDRFDGLGLTVNGQPVTSGEYEVFPGAYELALDQANFELAGDPVVVVTEPFASAELGDLEPVLTEAAVQEFRTLVRAAADACLASAALVAGCGLDLPPTLSDGTQMIDGTIERLITADGSTTIDSMVPTLSYDNPTLAQGDFIGGVETSGQCTKDGATGSCSVLFGPSLGRPSIDMAAENPTVLWD